MFFVICLKYLSPHKQQSKAGDFYHCGAVKSFKEVQHFTQPKMRIVLLHHFYWSAWAFLLLVNQKQIKPERVFALDIMMKYAVKMFIVRCSNGAIIHQRIPHCFGERPCHLNALARQNLEITFSSATIHASKSENKTENNTYIADTISPAPRVHINKNAQ